MSTLRYSRRFLLSLLGGAAAASFGSASGEETQAVATGYKLPEGPFGVVVTDDLLLRDSKRGKDLHVKVYAPQGSGPFPVILFSHGAGGSKDVFGPHVRHWASYGYAVLLPTHADSLALQRPPATAGASLEPGLLGVVRRSLGDARSWGERARDISFVLDALPEVERQVAALKGKMDARRIGVGGHSLGACTAMLLGGATIDLPGGPAGQSYADPRVRAVLAVSAQGAGEFGLTARSWDRMTLPLMTMTGSRDTGALGQGPEWRKQPFDRSPAGDKYHVFITGANHFAFGGELPQRGLGLGFGLASRGKARPGVAPSLPVDPQEVFDYAREATQAFWDATLSGDAKARAYLRSDELTNYSRGKVQLFRK